MTTPELLAHIDATLADVESQPELFTPLCDECLRHIAHEGHHPHCHSHPEFHADTERRAARYARNHDTPKREIRSIMDHFSDRWFDPATFVGREKDPS